MVMETASATDNITYWAFKEENRYGEEVINAAVDIKGRLELSKVQTNDEHGNEVSTDAVLMDLSQELAVGSIVWRGLKVDYNAANSKLFEVISFDEIPDVKGVKYRRTANLKRYRDQLPTISS